MLLSIMRWQTLPVHFKNYQNVGLTGGLTGWRASTVRHAARSACDVRLSAFRKLASTTVHPQARSSCVPSIFLGFLCILQCAMNDCEREHVCSRSCIVGNGACVASAWRVAGDFIRNLDSSATTDCLMLPIVLFPFSGKMAVRCCLCFLT